MSLMVSSQMADCGGLPQVVQVSCRPAVTPAVSLLVLNSNFSKTFFFCSQPGKLAEAFKYFVQGMGYSK